MYLLNRFWNDERGFLVSTETVGLATLMVCGGLVGWQTVRTAAVAEMADLADAIGSLDQSYSFAGFKSHSAMCSGSFFKDTEDLCDEDPQNDELAHFGRCIQLLDGPKEPEKRTEGVLGNHRLPEQTEPERGRGAI